MKQCEAPLISVLMGVLSSGGYGGTAETALITYIGFGEENGFTFAKDLETNIKTYQCTGMVSAHVSMEMLSRQMEEHFAQVLGDLRCIEISAGPFPVHRKRKLQQLPNVHLYNTWGSSETGGAVFLD